MNALVELLAYVWNPGTPGLELAYVWIIAIAAAAVSAAAGVYAAIQNEKDADAEVKALRNEGKTEELDRQQRLARVQAKIMASSAASGIEFTSGSVNALLQANEKQAEVEQFSSDFARKLRIAQIKARAKNQRLAADLNAVLGLGVDTATLASFGGGGQQGGQQGDYAEGFRSFLGGGSGDAGATGQTSMGTLQRTK